MKDLNYLASSKEATVANEKLVEITAGNFSPSVSPKEGFSTRQARSLGERMRSMPLKPRVICKHESGGYEAKGYTGTFLLCNDCRMTIKRLTISCNAKRV